MTVKVRSYDDSSSSYNSEATESKWYDYTITARFNEPAEAVVYLRDSDGSLMRKYNDDASDVYIGPGRLKIENPTATTIFDGRIMKAVHDKNNRSLSLHMKDWLSQLQDDRLNYDMRADLDGAGLRVSRTKTYLNSLLLVAPVYTSGGNYYMFDSDMTWSDDQFNGDLLVFDSSMSGDIEFSVGPFDETVTGANITDTPTKAFIQLWEEDGRHLMVTDNSDIEVYYDFKVLATKSDLYNSAKAFEIDIVYRISGAGTGMVFSISNKAHTSKAVISPYGESWSEDGVMRVTFKIYKAYLNDLMDANGEISFHILFENDSVSNVSILTFGDTYTDCILTDIGKQVEYFGGAPADTGTLLSYDNTDKKWWVSTTDAFSNTATTIILTPLGSGGTGILSAASVPDTSTLEIFAMKLYIKCNMDWDTDSYSITDTFADNRLKVDKDLSLTGAGIWEDVPYSIAPKVYKHIDSAEGGTLVTGGDPLVTLTSAGTIEHTSSFSLRLYNERIRFEILKDLASIDKTAFYIPIGTTALTWKSTFNDGAPTAMTDSSVIGWRRGQYDFKTVINEVHLYGPAVNNEQMTYDTSDAGTDPGAGSKTRYGVTRSNVVKHTGISTSYELEQLGEALVNRDDYVLLYLNADIRGLSALRLGDEVSITSTYLGTTAQVYVITFWEYTYSSNVTTIRLHPRNSTKGFVPYRMFGDDIRRLYETEAQHPADVYLPESRINIW